MGQHAEWEVVNKKPGIVLIRDLNQHGRLSITNDAEYVYDVINNYNFHRRDPIRIVYQQQDPNSEWWEIVSTPGNFGEWRIAFRPWHGEVWDKLTQTY